MELKNVGGRRTSQPPSLLHRHHQPHQHQHKHHKHKDGPVQVAKGPPSPLHLPFPPQFVHKKQCRYSEDLDKIDIFTESDDLKLKPVRTIGSRKQSPKWMAQATPKTQMNQYETTTTGAATLPHFCHLPEPNPEYSYAYCEPIVTKLNKSPPEGAIPTSHSSNALSKGPSAQSLRALLTKSFRKSSDRHTFTTRYGTKENIYEDVGAGPRRALSSESISKIPVAEELKLMQHQHDRIMGELNLSIETLLMPSADETELIERRQEEILHQHGLEGSRQLPSLQPFLVHANAAEFDSGISGSSSSGASYSESMRYRTSSLYPVSSSRNYTIFEAPSMSSGPPPSQRLSTGPLPPSKMSCCFYSTEYSSGKVASCGCPRDPSLEPIESISEKVNFWNKIGKIKDVFNVPESPKQQSPVDDGSSDLTAWWKSSGSDLNRIQNQPLPKR